MAVSGRTTGIFSPLVIKACGLVGLEVLSDIRPVVVLSLGVLATASISQVCFWRGRAFSAERGRDVRARRLNELRRQSGSQYRWRLAAASRFVRGFRLAIPASCGASGMSALVFTAADLTGAVLWVSAIGAIGVALSSLLHRVAF